MRIEKIENWGVLSKDKETWGVLSKDKETWGVLSKDKETWGSVFCRVASDLQADI